MLEPANETSMETIHKLLVEQNLVSQSKNDDKSIIKAVKRVLAENGELQEKADYVDQLELDHNILQLKMGQFIQNDIIGPPCDHSAMELFDPANTLDKNYLNFKVVNPSNCKESKKKGIGGKSKSKRKDNGKKESQSVDDMPRSILLQQLKDEVRKQHPTNKWKVQTDPKTDGTDSTDSKDSKDSNSKNSSNRNKNNVNDSNCDWDSDSCDDTNAPNRTKKDKDSMTSKRKRSKSKNKCMSKRKKMKNKNTNKSKDRESETEESKTAAELQLIYRDSILAYLTINNTEGSLNPLVLLTDLDDYWPTKKNFHYEFQNKVLTKYKIGCESNVESLRGQYGIKAKRNIPKYITIGQYIGVELTRRQYEHIYRDTEHNVNCNKYAYTAQFIHLVNERIDYNNRNDNVDLSIRDDWDSHTNSNSNSNSIKNDSGQVCTRRDYIDKLIDLDISNDRNINRRSSSSSSSNAFISESSGCSGRNRKRKKKVGSKKRGHSFVDCDMDTMESAPPRKRQRKNFGKRKYDSNRLSDNNSNIATETERNNNMYNDDEEVIVESRLCELIDNYGNVKINEIVIDGFAMKKLKNKKENLMILINDVRYDIEKENLSFQEQEKQNVEFVQSEVNGWPSIFVITKKNINKGDVILGDYGDQYCQAVKKQIQWEKAIRKEAQSKIKKARQVGINLIQDAEYFVQQSRM